MPSLFGKKSGLPLLSRSGLPIRSLDGVPLAVFFYSVPFYSEKFTAFFYVAVCEMLVFMLD